MTFMFLAQSKREGQASMREEVDVIMREDVDVIMH
jgi:hypothetical protein